MIRRRRRSHFSGLPVHRRLRSGGTVVVSPGGIQLTGTVDFNATGDNSIYTVRGGNLTVAAGGTSFNVDNVAVSGASAVIASNIIGSNGISVFGPGTLLLTGANTYGGGTFICSCASLQLGDATHTASIVGAVTNFGTFNIVNANTSGITSFTHLQWRQLPSGIAGTMAITNKNGGETDFGFAFSKDIASAGNAVIVNRVGGLTEFNGMSTAGNANITNRFGGKTDFFDNSNAGSATIVNRFAGITTFNDFSSAMNAGITNRFGGQTHFYE